MQPILLRKLKTFGWIFLFTSIAGVLFQLVNEKQVDHNSILVGIPLGLVFGVLELFVFPKAEKQFRQWSFTTILIFKTLLCTAVTYIVTVALATIKGFIDGRDLSELLPFITSREQSILVVYTVVVYGLLVFFLQVNRLLGEGVLWKFIGGLYHKPREEERIFMFLDMRSSTTVAEQLGHVRFYALLNDLFHEISQPVIYTKAEIYRYIGDEVVLTWEVEKGLENSNCLQVFFMFRENLLKNGDRYFKSFGVRPAFKAGLHFGKVISAQIGDLRQEISYNGDVLNTTARIQNECNNYHRDLLVSGPLMKRLEHMQGYKWERVDTVRLRGKETEVELFGVARL